jgi:hypothetical protein
MLPTKQRTLFVKAVELLLKGPPPLRLVEKTFLSMKKL